MKILLIIISTFIIAFLTSLALDLSWVAFNPVRYSLVVLAILVELAIGYFYAKTIASSKSE